MERSIDTLARYTIKVAVIALVCAACFLLRSVLVYILAAFIVSLIGIPLKKALKKISIKGRTAPDWLLAILSLILILLILGIIVTEAIPVVSGIVREASAAENQGAYLSVNPLENFNDWLIATFPSLGPDYRVEKAIVTELKDAFSFSTVSGFMTGLIGSVASVVSTIAVGLFSTVFISFFFIKDEKLFSKIVAALVPDKIEERVVETIGEIETLLSRYFVGLMIEVIGVALLDFLALWLIAGLGVNAAIGIAFIAGILNVIPYVGPLCGEVIGVLLAIILKLGTGAGLNVNIWVFALIVFACMLFVQLIDNFVYQPLIYSTSIKASPLEIFIVLLVAGSIAGVGGMFIAIPAYTVVRVIAKCFFYGYKPVRRLIPDSDGAGSR